jgi:hypothetical protein
VTTTQCDPTRYTIRFNVTPGNVREPYVLRYTVDGNETLVNGLTNGLYTLTIQPVITSYLSFFVEDTQGCQSNTIYLTAASIQRPTVALTLSGTRVAYNSQYDKITYTASGGIPPYTYTPVDTGQSNIFTLAPVGSPQIAVVTDNNQCTASHTFI